MRIPQTRQKSGDVSLIIVLDILSYMWHQKPKIAENNLHIYQHMNEENLCYKYIHVYIRCEIYINTMEYILLIKGRLYNMTAH